MYRRRDAAAILLAAGANNETRDIHNVTPAHYCAQTGNFDTFETILSLSKETAVTFFNLNLYFLIILIIFIKPLISKLKILGYCR